MPVTTSQTSYSFKLNIKKKTNLNKAMSHSNTLGKPLKVFIRENAKDDELPQPVSRKIKYHNVAPLTGEKARKFYEELLSEPSAKETQPKNTLVKARKTTGELCPKARRNTPTTMMPTFKNKDLLRMGQNNEVKNMQSFFLQNGEFDVDITDDFGWTPLMCAACSGAKDAVKLLLEKGADPSRTDRFGNTPLKLAKLKNFKQVADLIETAQIMNPDDKNEVKLPSPQPFYCDLCNNEFTAAKGNHESSTLHIFNCKHKGSVFYGIPESNKGFQLLLKEGWNKGEGLGPKGSGRKFPIKAALKKNRCGIGAPNTINVNQNKVAHTSNYEIRKMKILSRKQEKQFEKNFRLEFT